jgi:hypothetical protein
MHDLASLSEFGEHCVLGELLVELTTPGSTPSGFHRPLKH